MHEWMTGPIDPVLAGIVSVAIAVAVVVFGMLRAGAKPTPIVPALYEKLDRNADYVLIADPRLVSRGAIHHIAGAMGHMGIRTQVLFVEDIHQAIKFVKVDKTKEDFIEGEGI